MGRLRKIWAWGVLGLTAGCTIDTGTLEKFGIPPPNFERSSLAENPLLVALPRQDKDRVFEAVYQVLDNFGFDILESNRNDGRIETAPRVAPGIGLFLKPGSPDVYERALASLQSYRHRVSVLVLESREKGGIFIDVKVRKELEILERPNKSTVGAAIFRLDNDIDRHYEVIDASSPTTGWIYRGRDLAMEQELIRLIKAVLKV